MSKTLKQIIDMQKWLLSFSDKGHKIPAFIIYEKLNPIVASLKIELRNEYHQDIMETIK